MNEKENVPDQQLHTVGMAIWWASNALKEIGIKTADLDAEVLLAHLTGLTKEEIYFDPDRLIDEKMYFDFERLIARRKSGEPVAYITGKKEFFALEFAVDSCVLIPRPETEELVEKALEFVKDYNGKKLTILDIGTGSGAIAIAIAVSVKKWRDKYDFDDTKIKIIASDISEEAINKAKYNANRCKVSDKIEFRISDMFEEISHQSDIDLIVANLPYLDPSKKKEYSPELDTEPAIALYAGKKGLDVYKKLFREIKKLGLKPKKIIVECEEYQCEDIKKMGKNVECVGV